MLTSLNDSEVAHRTDQKVWVAFLATRLLSRSALAAVAVLIAFFFSRSIAWVAVIITLNILFWPIVSLVDFEPLQRASVLVSSIGSLDVDQVLRADHSGGIRIAAALIYLEDVSANEFGFWFGYGTEGLAQFLQYRIAGLGDTVAAGFMPVFQLFTASC